MDSEMPIKCILIYLFNLGLHIDTNLIDSQSAAIPANGLARQQEVA